MIPSWASLVKTVTVLAALVAGKALPGGTGLMVAVGACVGAILAGFAWAAFVRRVEGPT